MLPEIILRGNSSFPLFFFFLLFSPLYYLVMIRVHMTEEILRPEILEPQKSVDRQDYVVRIRQLTDFKTLTLRKSRSWFP